MTTLREALAHLKRVLDGPDFRTMQTKFTRQDEKELVEAMKDPSFRGQVARMSTAALQKSVHKMRGTNVKELVDNLDKILEQTALRNQKGGYQSAEIRQVSGTLKTVATLLEKNEQNQELTNIQTLTVIKGLEQLERFLIQTKRGDLKNTGEARLEREIARQLKENSNEMLTSKNLTRVLHGKNPKQEGDRINFEEKTRGARNILYSMLGPLGPVVKSIDDLVLEMGEHKETFKKVGGGLIKSFKTGWQALKKFGGAGADMTTGLFGRIGGRLGGLFGKGAGRAGSVIGKTAGAAGLLYGAFELGQLIGKVLNEFLPEDFKEKLGNAIGFLVDELPAKLGKMTEEFIKTTKQWFEDTLDWLKNAPGRAKDAIQKALPTWLGGTPEPPKTDLQREAETARAKWSKRAPGWLSNKYEGNDKSIFKDVNGSYSMGKFQLNEKGAYQAFLSQNPQYAEALKGLAPGSAEFKAKWEELTDKDPNFVAAQARAANSVYVPILKQAKGLGFSTEVEGVREAIISGAIQHSPQGNTSILKAAAADPQFSEGPGGQIRAYYKARRSYFDTAKMDASATPKFRANVQSRYNREEKEALAMVEAPAVNRLPISAPIPSGSTANSGPANDSTTAGGHAVSVASIPLVSEDAGMLLVGSNLVY